MSKYADSIYVIHNNPFVFTPLIVEFFRTNKLQDNNILLAYLILPLVLYEASQQAIKSSNVNSSLHTFKRKKETLYGFSDRIYKYKEITNQCLQHAIDNKYISLNDDLSVDVIEKKIKSVKSLNLAFKASSKICNIFKEQDVVSIYRLLGVKSL